MFNDSSRFASRPRLALAAIALLVAGGGVGAVIGHAGHRVEAMAPAAPVRIATLATSTGQSWGEPIVTVRGRITEAYGARFVLNDGSGNALIDLGRRGDKDGLYALGQTVTVQGHYREGTIRAAYLVRADGQVAALEPHGGPDGERHGHRGDRPDHGPRGGDRQDGDRGGDHGPDRGAPVDAAPASAIAPARS